MTHQTRKSILTDVTPAHTLKGWRLERNTALCELDMDYAKQVMPNTTDDVRLIAMRKGRYECTDIPRELRHTSGDWLRERGYRRMDGTPVLPLGELPK